MERALSQPRTHSLAESCANIAIGIGLNLLVLRGIFHASMVVNLGVTGLMTALSFIRQYSVRRFFNAWLCFERSEG